MYGIIVAEIIILDTCQRNKEERQNIVCTQAPDAALLL